MIYLCAHKYKLANFSLIGAVAAVMLMLYQSVVIKRDLSLKFKLSIYQSSYIPTLTYGHKVWVLTERMRSWIQVAEISFL